MAIFLLLACGISRAQIIDEVYFLNEDNRIKFFDNKTISFYKIINVEVEGAELLKSSTTIKHENDEWFINPTYAGTAFVKLTGEKNKKKTLKVLFMELPQMSFRFWAGEDLVTRIEDSSPEIYKEEKPFLDSLKEWKKVNPNFELKNTFTIYPKNLPKEIFTKIDSAFVDIVFEDSVVISNYKFKGSGLSSNLIRQIIKYPPDKLKAIFKDVHLTINGQISKKYSEIAFDFKK